MKRIEFIAPVESMRGNLGSKQTLVYAPNNNRAYDSYDDQLNPALNYEPRLIGAKSKRNYFCVKTKSSVRLTNNAKTAMSLLGALGAMYGGLVRDKMSNVYINAKGVYDDYVAAGYSGTFRKFLSGPIMDALRNKDMLIVLDSANHHVEITNPWVAVKKTDPAWNVAVPYDIYAKFFNKLGNGGVIYIDNDPMCFISSASAWYNYTNGASSTYYRIIIDSGMLLSMTPQGQVKNGGRYVIDEVTGVYQNAMDTLSNGQRFITTDVAP